MIDEIVVQGESKDINQVNVENKDYDIATVVQGKDGYFICDPNQSDPYSPNWKLSLSREGIKEVLKSCYGLTENSVMPRPEGSGDECMLLIGAKPTNNWQSEYSSSSNENQPVVAICLYEGGYWYIKCYGTTSYDRPVYVAEGNFECEYEVTKIFDLIDQLPELIQLPNDYKSIRYNFPLTISMCVQWKEPGDTETKSSTQDLIVNYAGMAKLVY